MDISTLHRDGWGISEIEGPDGSRNFCLELLVAGDMLVSVPLKTFPPDAAQPERERFFKFAAAMARFVNEEGDLEDAAAVLTAMANQDAEISTAMALVCIESEETHSRIYRRPDNTYIRVVENDFAEELSEHQMLNYLNDTQDNVQELYHGEEDREEEGRPQEEVRPQEEGDEEEGG